MSPQKQQLIELEKVGTFVFHDSSENADILEPRQVNSGGGIAHIDGDFAIFASPSIDYAIFMALLNKKNCPEEAETSVIVHGESIESDAFTLSFYSSQKTLEQLNDSSSGWVYVLKKEDFTKDNPAEYVAHQVLTPLEKIAVKKGDLPENIEIKEF